MTDSFNSLLRPQGLRLHVQREDLNDFKKHIVSDGTFGKLKLVACNLSRSRKLRLRHRYGTPDQSKLIRGGVFFGNIHKSAFVRWLKGNRNTGSSPRCISCGRLQGEPHAGGCWVADVTIRRTQ